MNRSNRDAIFYEVARWIGILGVIHEALIERGQRPYLIVMFGSMMGLSNLNWKGIGAQKISPAPHVVEEIRNASDAKPLQP